MLLTRPTFDPVLGANLLFTILLRNISCVAIIFAASASALSQKIHRCPLDALKIGQQVKKMTIIQNFIDFIIESFEFDVYAGGTFLPTLNRLYFMDT